MSTKRNENMSPRRKILTANWAQKYSLACTLHTGGGTSPSHTLSHSTQSPRTKFPGSATDIVTNLDTVASQSAFAYMF